MVPKTKSPVAVLTWPPPSFLTIDAVGGLGDDLVGVLGAGEQVRVGHADHREVLVALASAVARRLATLLAGPEPVPHVVGEDAVLDEDVAGGQVALVVDGEVAPLAEDGAVVDQGDERAGDELADLAGVDGGVLEDVVGFEAVPAGLVEQDAAAAAGQDDGDLARGGGTGVSLVRARVAAVRAMSSTAWRSKIS